jgi:hypothetical protein
MNGQGRRQVGGLALALVAGVVEVGSEDLDDD